MSEEKDLRIILGERIVHNRVHGDPSFAEAQVVADMEVAIIDVSRIIIHPSVDIYFLMDQMAKISPDITTGNHTPLDEIEVLIRVADTLLGASYHQLLQTHLDHTWSIQDVRGKGEA